TDRREPREERAAILAAPVVGKLVDVALPLLAAMDEHVLELGEPREMHLELCVAHADLLAYLATAEAVVRPRDREPVARGAHQRVELHEQRARLRRQLVEAPAEHLVADAVRELDVVARDLEVLEALSAMLDHAHRPLMLMQERNRADEREILH